MARTPRTAKDSATTVGCDIGGTAIKLVRLRGRSVEATLRLPTDAVAAGRRPVAVLRDAILELIPGDDPPADGPDPRAARAVGIALPGFLDAARERVVHLSNVPSLDGLRLRKLLETSVGIPVRLDTDTNAGAVGEATLGAGRGRDRVLYLTLGTGLGAAFTIGGEPVRVSRHTVGQVAHVPLDADGPRCRCGARGCAEALLSAAGILRRARALGLGRCSSALEVRDLAMEGRDAARRAVARRTWREIGRLLGRLCVTLGALLSPDLIVIGGGISGASALFLPEAARHVERHLGPRLGRAVPIAAASLGPVAGAVGAAILARRHLAAGLA